MRTGAAYPQRGFTLLELLVAVAVFAVLGAMAYGGLSTVLQTQSRTDEVAKRLQALQLAVRFMERDFTQLAQRPVRNQYGDEEPYLRLDPLAVQFTHAGWRNPAGLTRSHLQRVAYEVEDETLMRVTWPLLDGAESERVLKTSLLDSVQDLRMRVLDPSRKWHRQWPPLGSSGGKTLRARAVEITFKVEPWGEIRRLFLLPG